MAQLPHIGEQDKEILNAQTHIWNHTLKFINSGSLKCAVELDIPDIIQKHGRPMTLSELADAIPINNAKSDQLGRLMRALIHSGFFVKAKIQGQAGEEKDGYALSPPSTLLLKDNHWSIRPFLLVVLDPLLTQTWHHFSEWFRNEDPTPFDTAHGMSFYECAVKEPKLNRHIIDTLSNDSRLVMYLVIKYYKGVFEGLNSIVDVGGNTGTVAKIIADAFPDLKCTVFDLPHVVQDLEGTNNLDYVGGDMFMSIPSAHAILIKWVLHDWSDEESIKILKNCKDSIPSKENGGKVVIIDMVMDNGKEDNKSIETKIFFDILAMSVLTGRQRAEKDWAKLFFEAGFSNYKIIPILGLRSIIEVYP